MKRLSVYAVLVLTIASLVLAACGGQAKTKVRIVTDATWIPFEFVDEKTKQITGFDIDLMKAIAAKENLDIEFINVQWDPLLAGMAQCQYDAAISAMTITDERKKSFNFSDPYFAAGQLVAVRLDNTDITGPESLSGKKVGAQLGTTGEIEAKKIAGATVKDYDDIGLAFQDLMNGQTDAVIADNPLVLGYVGRNATKLKTVGKVFTDEFYGIAVCKTNTDLLKKLNDGLAKVKAEGLIEKLTTQWITSAGQ
jgi:polar amino acid transport system substrate-binding protein